MLHIAKRGQKIDVDIDNHTLTQVSSTKYLWVMIDSHLTWEQQVNFMVSKAWNKLFMYIIIRLHAQSPCSKPHLDYCDVAWSPSSSKLISQLEEVQKLATRIILQAPSTVRMAELYHTLKWQSLDQHTRFHTVLYVFKVLNNL